MKITKDRLKQLIKEEYKALNERYELPPIPRGMAYPDQDGIYPMSDDDGFPVYQSYPENIYEIPKYEQFFDWLDSQKPQGPPQGPPEKFFDPDPDPGPSIGLEENQEEGAWERAMARIRRLSDQAKTSGTALATKAGREIKMHINQLKKDGSIDEPTWRKARRALYKDKTGDMAIQILVDAVGPGEVEGALGDGFDDDDDITGPALDAVRGLRESKLTKSMLKQIIKEELDASLNESDRYWQSQQNALAKMNRNRGPSLGRRTKWALQSFAKDAKALPGVGTALKKLPFIGGVLTGAGLLLAAQEAMAKSGPAGVMQMMSEPENQQAIVDGIASLTGVGSAAVIYKDILNAADLKLSKSDAFGGAAPAHTQKAGQPGRNCWTNKPVPGFPHCDELKESKLTKSTLKQFIKEELNKD